MEFLEKNKYIHELDGGTIVVDSGPMLMSIYASKAGKPISDLARQGANTAMDILGTLAKFQGVITQNITEITSVDLLPPVVKKMILAARKFRDATATPLIAVAGACADEVADSIYKTREADKVVINNGGDIAIRLSGKEIVKIGIKTNLDKKGITHTLIVTAKSGIKGVATSGFGGRSFTRGIANAAVAVAGDAVSADVAATLIGNATDVQSSSVVRSLAKNLYHATDIPDLWITTYVGHLEKPEIDLALDHGIQKAKTFQDKGLILGAFLALKGQVRISESIASFVELVSDPV